MFAVGLIQTLSCVVAFPVSEAIVESSRSVIDAVISNKVAFKDAETPDTQMGTTILVGPTPRQHQTEDNCTKGPR